MERIGTEEDLEKFNRLAESERKVTPALRGILAETAVWGIQRYGWELIRPLIAHILDKTLLDYDAEARVQIGPPAPLPSGETISQLRKRFRQMLADFPAAPFTLQRLCELLLEPHKQYSRLDKLALAFDKLLDVSLTQEKSENPPPRPSLHSLPPVNESSRVNLESAEARSSQQAWEDEQQQQQQQQQAGALPEPSSEPELNGAGAAQVAEDSGGAEPMEINGPKPLLGSDSDIGDLGVGNELDTSSLKQLESAEQQQEQEPGAGQQLGNDPGPGGGAPEEAT